MSCGEGRGSPTSGSLAARHGKRTGTTVRGLLCALLCALESVLAPVFDAMMLSLVEAKMLWECTHAWPLDVMWVAQVPAGF